MTPVDWLRVRQRPGAPRGAVPGAIALFLATAMAVAALVLAAVWIAATRGFGEELGTFLGFAIEVPLLEVGLVALSAFAILWGKRGLAWGLAAFHAFGALSLLTFGLDDARGDPLTFAVVTQAGAEMLAALVTAACYLAPRPAPGAAA